MTAAHPPAGWYPDGSGRSRWWDGGQWTEHFQDAQPQVPAGAAVPAVAVAPATSTAPVRLAGQDTVMIAAYVACALVVVGSLGPWGTVFGLSVAGTSGDGVMTLIGAVLAAGTVFLTVNAGAAKPKFKAPWITVVLGALITLIAIIDIVDISSVEGVSPGWGIWIVLLAGGALTGVGVVLARRPRS